MPGAGARALGTMALRGGSAGRQHTWLLRASLQGALQPCALEAPLPGLWPDRRSSLSKHLQVGFSADRPTPEWRAWSRPGDQGAASGGMWLNGEEAGGSRPEDSADGQHRLLSVCQVPPHLGMRARLGWARTASYRAQALPPQGQGQSQRSVSGFAPMVGLGIAREEAGPGRCHCRG